MANFSGDPWFLLPDRRLLGIFRRVDILPVFAPGGVWRRLQALLVRLGAGAGRIPAVTRTPISGLSLAVA
jgi:hypothetical protein